MAFFVFLAGATGTRIVAANFCGGADGLGRFSLRRTGLILQIALLPGLLAFKFAGYGRQMLRQVIPC